MTPKAQLGAGQQLLKNMPPPHSWQCVAFEYGSIYLKTGPRFLQHSAPLVAYSPPWCYTSLACDKTAVPTASSCDDANVG